MLKYLIIFTLTMLSLQGLSQDTCLYFQRYIHKGDSIFKRLRSDTKSEKFIKKDSSKFKDAINAYNTAMLHCPKRAQEARDSILKVFEYIEQVKQVAISQRIRAEYATEAARKANDSIEALKIATYKYTLANAPYKYIRLLKDGPNDKEKIKKDSFDYKLIAYCSHLVSIKDSMKIKEMDTAIDTLNSLVEKLYFNNDLYEKVYFCLEANGGKDAVLYKDAAFKILRDSLLAGDITINSFTDKLNLPDGKKIIAYSLAEKQQLLFCATEDNNIFVFDSNHAQPIIDKPIQTIAMGAKVTALDFEESTSTLFFGTVKGDIGFIRYNIERKNQPVYDFENSLGSRITAIECFKYRDASFLLVSALNSKAAVFELDSNYLVANNKISGNILPDKELGSINDAKFDTASHTVKLQTTSKSGTDINYSWNPFAYEILEKLKKVLDFKPPHLTTEKEKDIWIKSKFY